MGSGKPGPSAPQAVAVAAGEPAVQDASEEPQPEAAVARDAVEAQPAEAAVARGAVEAARRQEARDAVEELPWAALQQEAGPSVVLWALLSAELLLGVLPSAARPSALPSAVAWAFRRDRALPSARPVPSSAARLARAKACLRIASP